MKKYGFTLIELLAVIVIIAIIALITVPIILNVIEESQKSSFVESSRNYANGLELEIMKADLEKKDPPFPIPKENKYVAYNLVNMREMLKGEKLKGFIIVTNKNNKYDYYLFTSNGKYSICNVLFNEVKKSDVQNTRYCQEIIPDDFEDTEFQELYGDELDAIKKPVISVSEKGEGVYDSSPVTVTITAEEGKIKYKEENGEWQDYTKPFLVSSNKTIYAYAYIDNDKSKEVNHYIGIIVPTGWIPVYDTDTLNNVRKNLSARYIVMRDFEITDDNFLPIGMNESNPDYRIDFTGQLNGNNMTISNLKINRPDFRNVGLFAEVKDNAGSIDNPIIWNLTLKNVDIIANGVVGSLAGNITGIIKNIKVTGNVTGLDDVVGGIVGSLQHSNNFQNSIRSQNLYFEGNVKGIKSIGGIVAGTSSAIDNANFKGSIKGTEYVGGIVGSTNFQELNLSTPTNYNFAITNSSSSGTVFGDLVVGGIIGDLNTVSRISVNSNNTSNAHVKATRNMAGGIVGRGYNSKRSTIEIKNTSFLGKIESPENVGGIIGYAVGPTDGTRTVINNCYTKSQITGQNNVGGIVGSAGLYTLSIFNSTFRITNSYSNSNISKCDTCNNLLGTYGINQDIADITTILKIENSYWNKNIENSKYAYGNFEVGGKTEAEMTANPYNDIYTDWDFTNTWKRGKDNFPILK